jgi:hypothetical protein
VEVEVRVEACFIVVNRCGESVDAIINSWLVVRVQNLQLIRGFGCFSTWMGALQGARLDKAEEAAKVIAALKDEMEQMR